MVKVKRGMKSDAKPNKAKSYATNLCQLEHKGVALFCSSASKIESGYFLVLLSAVARQCTMYRTVILKIKPDEDKAERLLKKWIKTLPISTIR